MRKKAGKVRKNHADSEKGTIRKSGKGFIQVALVYPNTYQAGMSNLGFQTVYERLNSLEHVSCERFFLPDRDEKDVDPRSVESGKRLGDADFIAFSVSFENDYLNLVQIIDKAALPLRSSARKESHPFLIAGGVACFLNPEPLAPFMDLFLLGEAEELLTPFFESFDPQLSKDENLKVWAKSVPGCYVPQFYTPSYNDDGTLASFIPDEGVPASVKSMTAEDISQISTCSTIVTPESSFKNTYLIEVSRGCPHGCRFCSAGFIYRPPRFRPPELIEENIKKGASLCNHIGLVGAAVSDYPDLTRVVKSAENSEVRFSFSSLRADAMNDDLISAMKESEIKTATIAPEAGSERMRRVINKGVTEDDIISAARIIVEAGIINIKMYFMIGLPTETDEDIKAISDLVKKVKEIFLETSRIKKRMGHITVGINPFVPKPATPFQWAAMDDRRTLKRKVKAIKSGLKGVSNVRVHADTPRGAYVNALLSRGDRRVAVLMEEVHKNGGNWSQTLKESEIDPDFYITRERPESEKLPWDFIDQGVSREFLLREYDRARANKNSPDCPMLDSCKLCGACK